MMWTQVQRLEMACLVFLEHKSARSEAAKEGETITKSSYATWGWAWGAIECFRQRRDMVRPGCQVENRLRDKMMGKVSPVIALVLRGTWESEQGQWWVCRGRRKGFEGNSFKKSSEAPSPWFPSPHSALECSHLQAYFSKSLELIVSPDRVMQGATAQIKSLLLGSQFWQLRFCPVPMACLSLGIWGLALFLPSSLSLHLNSLPRDTQAF